MMLGGAQKSKLLVLLITASVVQLGVHSQNLAPAPSSTLPQRCQTCPRADQNTPLNLTLNVITGTDVAQFYSYTTEGAILVYFVARANFSVAPAQLSLTSFDIDNGNLLEIQRENACNSFLLKGVVQQRSAWYERSTNITISTNDSSTTDCGGHGFPSASASYTSRNGPIGSLYVPGLAYTAAGPITTLSTNLVQLTFSEPIQGLTISQLNVTLSEATDSQDNGVACVPSYRSQATPAVSNSTQFYNVYVTVPDCFYGQVNVGFIGQVVSMGGQNSLPIKPVGFNRVATNIPVSTSLTGATLPALGKNLSCA